MGVRCSVLGCEYEDSQIERERERRGDEVILTVREFKECTRCGNTELISENTGVTSVPDDQRAGPSPDSETDVGRPTPGDEVPEPDERVTGGDAETDRPAAEEFDEASDPEVTDDAVLLGEASEDATESPSPTPEDAPTAHSVDESDAADSGEVSASTPEGGRIELDHGDWPDHEGDTDDGLTGEEAIETAGDTPEEAEAPAGESASDPSPDDRDAELIEDTSEDRPGGFDEVAVDDGPAVASAIAEAERDAAEEYPEDDAVILDSGGPDRSGASNSGGGAGRPEASSSGGGDPSTASASAGGTDSGAWPDHETGTGQSDAGEWPDHGGTDEGFDARPDDGGESDVEFSGLTPSADAAGADPAADAATVSTDRPLAGESEPAGSGQAMAAPDADAEGESAGPARARGELYCSGCGHSVPQSDSPHCGGDICPDCSREYLTER